MNNIIEFPNTKFDYIKYRFDENNKPYGIVCRNAEFWLAGDLTVNGYTEISLSAEELKMVMIMWLSLVDPSVINYDADSLK